MTSRARFLGAAAAAATSAAFPTALFAQSRKTLGIGYVPSTLFAPLFVAAERGYLREAGFEPNLTPIVAGQDSMALVAQGQLDVVAAALSAAFFNAVNRGLDVKFVAATAYQPRGGRPASALMVRQDLYDGGLRSPAGLRGRKIGWNGGAGAASAYYVARILRPANLHVRDVDPINIAQPDQEAALERKAIDAVFAASPLTEVFAQRKLAQIVGQPPAGIAASGVFFGATLLANVENARAVMGALRRAAADIAGSGWFSQTNLDAYAKYTKQTIPVLKAAPRYDVKPDLRIDEGTLEDMQREFVDQGILTYKQPLNEVRLVARF
ncbi:MAG: ABC transporter substrate-binding protein [Candidatus Eremiobacteraeota bacterium]|nr:ABC transporter substrate-binding protein [Candidatus Eremiobacteraeota bacterium]